MPIFPMSMPTSWQTDPLRRRIVLPLHVRKPRQPPLEGERLLRLGFRVFAAAEAIARPMTPWGLRPARWRSGSTNFSGVKRRVVLLAVAIAALGAGTARAGQDPEGAKWQPYSGGPTLGISAVQS